MSIEVRRHYAVALAMLAVTSFRPPTARTSSASAGTVTATAAMRAVRAAHTTTMLRNGRVLVAGGFTGDDNAVSGAEL